MGIRWFIHLTVLTLDVIVWCSPDAIAFNDSNLKRCQNTYKNLTLEQKASYIDASGKPASGIYGGNTLWYGSYSECKKIPDSRYCWTTFLGYVALPKIGKEVQQIQWGVCTPNDCIREDGGIFFDFLFQNVSGINIVTPIKIYFQVKCAEDPGYTASAVVTIIFCGILVGLCLLATIMEVISGSNGASKSERIENDKHISMENDPDEKTPLLPNVTTNRVGKNDGTFYEIVNSFSMIRNVNTILNTNVRKSDLTYLHGIRVLSLFWIILFHVYVQTFAQDNRKDVAHFKRKFASMVLNTAYGVDTFFILSGLLVVYVNMSKKVKNNGQTNWFKYYLHRFWRLTPTLMFWILFVAKLKKHFGAGPIWFQAIDYSAACSENWWTNLLYLNNFFHVRQDEMCLVHTWQLADDMQFFILSPFLLIIAYRFGFRRLLGVVGVVILASIIVTASLIAHYDYPPLTVLITRAFVGSSVEDRAKSLEEFNGFFKDVYVKPYCRIPPYVMGIVLGYVLFKHFSKEFKLPMKLVVMMWLGATALAVTVVYAPYGTLKEDPRIWTKGENILFGSLKWCIWGLCIIWLIFACHYNYAGLVKNILAAKFWIPLSHINYAAYIVHFDIISTLAFNIETPIHYTSFTLVTYFLASVVLTYLIAFIVTVVVELPCANLEAIAWKKWEKK
ncbi:nose resistant to fluoxetine protein 6-like [Dendronephthya gigantea]|uniref:nose resistant to fluoxetine protein 6-like n=1 Tax=Dendronephthya gigantea TaxID=151771 RepID=UPI001069DCD4|nr:nose resistant to fluoxetine protein 6-like [Dendronephthya gigantea]